MCRHTCLKRCVKRIREDGYDKSGRGPSHRERQLGGDPTTVDGYLQTDRACSQGRPFSGGYPVRDVGFRLDIPDLEQLVVLGYDVTSFSLKELSLKIKW